MPNKAVEQLESYNTLLNAEMEKERIKEGGTSVRLLALVTLMAFHMSHRKGGYEAWKATLIAGRLGIPAPLWAIDSLEKAEHIALNDLPEKGDKKIGIDVLLGFKGIGKGGGKTSAVQISLQNSLREQLCHSVRLLVSTGVPLKTACRTVAKKLTAIQKPSLERHLKYPNAESLERTYTKWVKECDQEVLSLYDKGFASVPREIKERVRDKFKSEFER